MSSKQKRDPHHHMAAPDLPPDDGREARELSASENADLCEGCTKCCTYITVEIDSPRAAWEYDQWIWALYHQNVSMYIEVPERWFLAFDTVCTRLDKRGRCSIYGRHPVLCREYDPRTCERRLPLTETRAWFHDGDELEAWLKTNRPAHYKRLMAHRRDTAQGPPIADALADRRNGHALVTIGEPERERR